MSKIIFLTQNRFTIVDDEDYKRLSRYKWYVMRYVGVDYAARGHSGRRMHREIMNCPEDKIVDHINHNGLDNRKCNLRICSRQQNRCNCKKRKHKGDTSIYKGVGWCRHMKKWKAFIRINGKNIHLGLFESEVEAAKAYDKKAKKYKKNLH